MNRNLVKSKHTHTAAVCKDMMMIYAVVNQQRNQKKKEKKFQRRRRSDIWNLSLKIQTYYTTPGIFNQSSFLAARETERVGKE
jgi:hypothetical protein